MRQGFRDDLMMLAIAGFLLPGMLFVIFQDSQECFPKLNYFQDIVFLI